MVVIVREIPLFQGKLGWWNIIIWPAKNPWFEKWWRNNSQRLEDPRQLGSETSETGFLFWRVLYPMGFPRLWQFVEIPKCMKKSLRGKNINLNCHNVLLFGFPVWQKTAVNYIKCPVCSKLTYPRTTNGPQGSDDLGREFRNCLDQWSWGNSEGIKPWFGLLVGGFKQIFLLSSLPGEIIQFD